MYRVHVSVPSVPGRGISQNTDIWSFPYGRWGMASLYNNVKI